MSKVFVNDDFMRFVNSKYHENYKFGETGEKEIRDFIRKFEGSTVTDFVFNVNAQMSYSPSNVWMTAEDKYNKTEENGHKVDYKETFYKVWYDIFVLQKLDMYKIWIEELRKIGISPWISFRINDTHDNDKRYGGIRRSDYFDKARENGLVRSLYREKNTYYDDCFDFTHKEVRDYHLAYIKEQLERYDVDGVDIDYMREPFLCVPGEEGKLRLALLEYFGEIKKLISIAEEKYGHKIKLLVRTFRDIRTTYDSGLDIYTLIREKIIDVVVPTPRFKTCDSDMPIYEWRKTFENDDVLIAAGMDLQYMTNFKDTCYLKPETISALSVQYLTNGADGVYWYNYTYSEDFEAYKYMGDIDALLKRERRHIVSFQDIGYLHTSLYRPLPLTLAFGYLMGDYKYLRIQTGKITDGSKVVLRLGCNQKLTDVYVNGAKCEFIGMCEIEKEYSKEPVFEYEITKYNQTEQIVEIKFDEETVLSYAEIRIF